MALIIKRDNMLARGSEIHSTQAKFRLKLLTKTNGGVSACLRERLIFALEVFPLNLAQVFLGWQRLW